MRVHVIWSFLFILLTVALLQIQTGRSPNAHEYNHRKSSDPTVKFDEETGFGIVYLGVALYRKPDLGPEYVSLQLSDMDHLVNTCLEFSDYEYETKYQDRYFELKITGFDLKYENLSQHPHYECDGKIEDQILEVIINKDDLKKNGTKLVKIASGPAMEYFDLTLTDNKIELTASETHKALSHEYMPKKIYGRKNSMMMWFYPENTLILYVPGTMAGSEEQTKKVVEEAAARSGLVPLEDIITDFETPLTVDNRYYFVDKSGLVAARMNTDGGVLLDNVKIRASSYGLEQDVPLLKNIPVYAKKPNANE